MNDTGEVRVADNFNCRIRSMTELGVIETVPGSVMDNVNARPPRKEEHPDPDSSSDEDEVGDKGATGDDASKGRDATTGDEDGDGESAAVKNSNLVSSKSDTAFGKWLKFEKPPRKQIPVRFAVGAQGRLLLVEAGGKQLPWVLCVRHGLVGNQKNDKLSKAKADASRKD